MVNCFLARGGWLPEQLKMNGGWESINITSGLFVSRDAESDQKINIKLKLSRASLFFHGCKT